MTRLFRYWTIILLAYLPSLTVFAKAAQQPPKSVKPETVVIFDLIAEKDVQKGTTNLLTEMVSRSSLYSREPLLMPIKPLVGHVGTEETWNKLWQDTIVAV